jgi:hypothetical protein
MEAYLVNHLARRLEDLHDLLERLVRVHLHGLLLHVRVLPKRFTSESGFLAIFPDPSAERDHHQG